MNREEFGSYAVPSCELNVDRLYVILATSLDTQLVTVRWNLQIQSLLHALFVMAGGTLQPSVPITASIQHPSAEGRMLQVLQKKKSRSQSLIREEDRFGSPPLLLLVLLHMFLVDNHPPQM